MRRLILGGERIDLAAVQGALEVLAPRGLDRGAITPAYGLAEATLAVTVAEPDRPFSARPAPGDGGPVVSCGSPLPGFSVRIDRRSDETVGEICVRAPSLSTGYIGNPELTATRFRDGELRTGDLGFVTDGELHVVGRLDDLLVIGGRNVHARDVEAVLARDGRLRAGACAVVDLPGDGRRARFAAVAETTHQANDLEPLARDLAMTAMESAGLPIDECVLLPRGAFPKTPSGKPQRFRCREIASGEPAGAVRIRLRQALEG